MIHLIVIKLLYALKASGYAFQLFKDFLEKPQLQAVILKHDVDALAENSLKSSMNQAFKTPITTSILENKFK